MDDSRRCECGEPDSPLRILLVDHHALMRFALRELLDREPDMRVVAEARDGAEAAALVGELRPHDLDLVLMGLDPPYLDGIVATREILTRDPTLPVVVMSASSSEEDLLEAVRAGAVGYLPRSIAPLALVRALRDFHAEGALPMTRTMAARVLTQLRREAARSTAEPAPAVDGLLSPREREVLELLAEGRRDREIAERLVVSQHTVKRHVEHILRKLGARNRTEAVTRLHGRS